MVLKTTQATDIKNRAGALVNEASNLAGQARAKQQRAGRPVPEYPLPDAKEAIHAAMEAEHYAGMVILHDLPRDKDLAERCLTNAKAHIAHAEKSLLAAKAALARM